MYPRRVVPVGSVGLIYVWILLCFHQARAIRCYCSDNVYLYQLMVKSVIFYTLREWSVLVNEMLLMMAGDVESNPGPGGYVYHTIVPSINPTLFFSCGSKYRVDVK